MFFALTYAFNTVLKMWIGLSFFFSLVLFVSNSELARGLVLECSTISGFSLLNSDSSFDASSLGSYSSWGGGWELLLFRFDLVCHLSFLSSSPLILFGSVSIQYSFKIFRQQLKRRSIRNKLATVPSLLIEQWGRVQKDGYKNFEKYKTRTTTKNISSAVFGWVLKIIFFD